MAQRENWGTKIGIILAVAGSAVGLGNFLRFPGQACQNGGGAFMIPYFISFILLGIPLCWIEWTMGRYGGRHSHGSLPGIFDAIVKRPWAKYLGVLGLFVPLVIFFYYVYIESWCLAYSVFALTGKYKSIAQPEGMKTLLNEFRGLVPNHGLGIAYAFFLATFIANMVVIYRGLAKGIEFLCKVALPVLVVGAVVLVVRIFTLDTPVGAPAEQTIRNGLGFMWNPNFATLRNPDVWMAAAGQIFFTLSVGLGAIMTYASYLRERDDVALSSLTACSMNELVEVVLGGSIVIPAAFLFFGAVGAQKMSASIFGLGSGILDEFDFWGGTLAITICALVEVLVFVFYMGIQNGWKELHIGADITLPSWIRYVFYVTPVYLGAIVLYWAVFSWVPWILKPMGIDMKIAWSASFPWLAASTTQCPVDAVIIGTRLCLLLLLAGLLALIWFAWQRKGRSVQLSIDPNAEIRL